MILKENWKFYFWNKRQLLFIFKVRLFFKAIFLKAIKRYHFMEVFLRLRIKIGSNCSFFLLEFKNVVLQFDQFFILCGFFFS